MKKIQLIETVADAVRGQAATEDSGKFIHFQDLEYELAMAYESAVISFFSTPGVARNFDTDYFAKSYTATVKDDSGQLYLDIPAQPIALPGAQGIRSLVPKNSYEQIVRVSEAEWLNLRNLEAACCSPWPFCYVDLYNRRINLQGNRSEYNLLDEIRVKLVPKFTGFDDDEEINTPGGDYSLTQMVLQVMGIRPTDNSNDDGR